MEKIPLKIDVCSSADVSDENCLINRLFNQKKSESVIAKLTEIYGKQNAHLYSTSS